MGINIQVILLFRKGEKHGLTNIFTKYKELSFLDLFIYFVEWRMSSWQKKITGTKGKFEISEILFAFKAFCFLTSKKSKET